MNPGEVDEIFSRLLEAPECERVTLLAAISDPTAREEARRLLAHHHHLTTDPGSITFLESLDLGLASQLVDTDEAVPDRIGRFEVLRLIGRGASGAVYLARDPELGREVAVKLLASDLSTSPSATRRFKEEARAASMLDHPNVVTVFEVGQTDAGRLYIAMAYHEGETLRDRIRRGPLTVEEATQVALDVAGGLAAAHANGIVHRDIKPENILLTSRGTRIVDFGIAKAIHGLATRTGAAVGTAAYMSPEQTRGDSFDHRSDLWSLGVVMYEMLSGVRPFNADAGDALIYGIRHDQPASLTNLRPGIPADLAVLVERCLAKEPERRFGSAAELIGALESQVSGRGGPWPGSATRRRAVPLASAMAALGLMAWWGWTHLSSRTSQEPVPNPGVAVLPWRTPAASAAELGEGIVDLLSFSIDGVGGLRKIAPAVVIPAWRSLGSPFDDQGQLEVGRAVEARYLVTGSVVPLGGGRVSLLADVHDMRRNRLRGSAQVQGPVDSISLLVDQLTIELLRLGLLPYDGTDQPASLSTVTTNSLPALKAFLAGEREFRVARWADAARHYLRAIEDDPRFARALFRLIKAIDWGVDLQDRESYLERLEPLVNGLPDRDRMLIIGEMGSRFPHSTFATQKPQIELLEEMLSRFPDEVEGWVALGDRYYHDRGELLLPPDGYRKAFRQAIKLNPYFAEPYIHLIEDAFFMLDSTEARRLVAEFRQINPGLEPCSLQLVLDLSWGSGDTRQKALAALDTLPWDRLGNCFPRTGLHPIAPEAREALWASVARGRSGTDLVLWTLDYITYRVRPMISKGNFSAVRDELASWEGLSGSLSWWSERLQIMMHLSGFRDSAAAHRAAKRLSESPPTAPGPAITSYFWIGLLAAQERRWPEVERMAMLLDSMAPELSRRYNDERADRVTSAHARALRAYQSLVNGGIAELPAMDTAIAELTPLSIISPPATLRLMVGQLLLERMDLDDARRYFSSFGPIDLMATRTILPLGVIAELQGRRNDAVELYRRFLGWWQDADPEYQPLVEQARGGLRRLGFSSP